MSIGNIGHSTDSRNIPPELVQALSSVVSKRQYNVALQALALAEGDREALEEENKRLTDVNENLVADNERLNQEVSRLKQALQPFRSLVRGLGLHPKEQVARN